ncbi:MAG: TIGR03960 family B12-binding radical SAM protein, partial [Lachnospiraceae bacterium]|nr:TIGR03960 family B12-binding radical SAM protein [Lachnospiraceae bacterium]
MTYKQALPDRVLMSVEKPARYTGGEINSIIKDRDKVDVRIAMCFPDVYEIGMSYLGIQILYSMFNSRDDIWCERVYSVWPDLHRIMKEENIPLFALESQDPIKEFDFLGITLQYEMAYTNVLQILDLSGIPFHSWERGEDDPIVMGGGPCAFNPEPIADFFDIFYIGEGETVYFDLVDAYKANKAAGGTRLDFLKKAAQIEGLYVPQFYEAAYAEDGKISHFGPRPEYAGIAPEKIRKQVVTDVSEAPYPDAPVVPYVQVTQDRAVLEIQRGCIRGCRFCQAGMIYRPFRIKSLETLKNYSKYLIDNTGYDEISLSSLSSSDYPFLGEYLDFLIAEMGERKVNISLPSLRIDEFSLDVMNKVQDVKKSSLTFAPEAGTQRMRNVINKGLTEDDIIHGATLAFSGGWQKVKLYFMLGLPTETEEDIQGIAQLAELIAET